MAVARLRHAGRQAADGGMKGEAQRGAKRLGGANVVLSPDRSSTSAPPTLSANILVTPNPRREAAPEPLRAVRLFEANNER